MKPFSGASTAPSRSISAAAAGMSLTQIASRFSLTSSLVRPVLTDWGRSSASQPATAAESRFLISSHCSESSSNAVVGADPGRRLVRTIV
jgi:hypothetical protein